MVASSLPLAGGVFSGSADVSLSLASVAGAFAGDASPASIMYMLEPCSGSSCEWTAYSGEPIVLKQTTTMQLVRLCENQTPCAQKRTVRFSAKGTLL